MRKIALVLAATSALLSSAAPGEGQQVEARFGRAVESRAPVEIGAPGLPSLRVAKWLALAGSAAIGGWGFATNHDADRRLESLEQRCAADDNVCGQRLPNGAYADAELEAIYQDVLRLDRRARVALLASQVGVAATVVLFILDLRQDGSPPNIPFKPKHLDVMPATEGGIEFRYSVPLR